MRFFRRIAVATLLAAVAGCVWFAPPPPGIGKPVSWSDLPGWQRDRLGESWPALLRSCSRINDSEPRWQRLCAAAETMSGVDDTQARNFYEKWFVPHRVHGAKGSREGLITGYYEPLLFGSRVRSDRFRFPLYGRPADLLTVDLGELYPELRGKRVRGRLQGARVVPYYSRAQIDSQPGVLSGTELLWVDDPVALFFLQVQGSGRVRLTDGSLVGVGYADQNGHPYRSIGRELIEMGELQRDEVSLFTIRDWLKRNPARAAALLNRNPSYVFFTLREDPGDGAIGSLNVPLTPERSVAVDRSVIPLGFPVWLDTTYPDGSGDRYQRLVLAQDTGGAITGPVRVDVFYGSGDRAERLAGAMKQSGRLYVLLPRE